MKRFTFTFIFCATILAIVTYADKPQNEPDNQDTLIIKNAELFYETDFPIHAVTFDNNELMYVGGHKSIYTITPSKELKHFIILGDTTINTMIWNFRFGSDNFL